MRPSSSALPTLWQYSQTMSEIGPGQGALTEYLHQALLARYLAVEIDRDLAPLPPRFPG